MLDNKFAVIHEAFVWGRERGLGSACRLRAARALASMPDEIFIRRSVPLTAPLRKRLLGEELGAASDPYAVIGLTICKTGFIFRLLSLRAGTTFQNVCSWKFIRP